MAASVTNCMNRKEPNVDFQELWMPEVKTYRKAPTFPRTADRSDPTPTPTATAVPRFRSSAEVLELMFRAELTLEAALVLRVKTQVA